MSEKIRNLAIALAILIVAVTFAVPTIGNYLNDKKFDKAKSECIRENDNAFYDNGYKSCMGFRGYKVN